MNANIIRFLIFSALSLPILFFIHSGLRLDSITENLQVIIFATSLSSSIVWPIFRKFILLISLLLIICMAIFFVFDMIFWADVLGSTAFGLVILVILCYFPQFIKQGFIKKV